MFVSRSVNEVTVVHQTDNDYRLCEYIERYVYNNGEAPEPTTVETTHANAIARLTEQMSRLAVDGVDFRYNNGQLVWDDQDGTNYTYICL